MSVENAIRNHFTPGPRLCTESWNGTAIIVPKIKKFSRPMIWFRRFRRDTPPCPVDRPSEEFRKNGSKTLSPVTAVFTMPVDPQRVRTGQPCVYSGHCGRSDPVHYNHRLRGTWPAADRFPNRVQAFYGPRSRKYRCVLLIHTCDIILYRIPFAPDT